MKKGSANKITQDPRAARDIRALARMISDYCGHVHEDRERKAFIGGPGMAGEYLKGVDCRCCPECRRLLLHGVSKRILCRHEPKPQCKSCPDPCYTREYRERIREVMRFKSMESA